MLTHATRAFHRDRERLLREDMLACGKSEFGDLVMQAVNRKIVDRIDSVGSNQIAVVREYLDLGVGLKVGKVLITHRERIPRNVGNRFSLRRTFSALYVALSIFRFTRAKRSDLKIVHSRFTKNAIALQMSSQNAPTSDNSDTNHERNLKVPRRMAK